MIAPSLVIVLLGFLASGVWVFVAIFAVAMTAVVVETNAPLLRLVAMQVYNGATTPELLALPLFVLMAEILFRTRVAERLFSGLAPLTVGIPGRLIHVNVFASALFSAVCGSSAATTATVGRITLAELRRRGYPEGVVAGSLAGAGTLGFLIPPSLIMIIYGVLTETSVLKLFTAGILPGVALGLFYMATIAIVAGKRTVRDATQRREPGWVAQSLRDVGPVLGLVALIMGAMYGGFATPTEAAVIGVAGALVIAATQRMMTLPNIAEAMLATARTTAMMGLLLVAGGLLSISMGYIGAPRAVAAWVSTLGLEREGLLLAIFLCLLVLGCFLDGTSILIMTLPIILPLAVEAGVDKVWFGVFLVLVIELAQITPPIGFNLFVIQGLTGMSITRIAWHALPFFVATALFTALVTIFPGIVLFLPSLV